MTAVFVAHTKVLTAVRLSTKQKKLSITVPKLDHFVHRVFRETARAFWKVPYLFMDTGSVVERQKNVLQVEAAAIEAITTAVRSLLPVKQILKDYMEDDEDDIATPNPIQEGPISPEVRPSEESKDEEAVAIPEVAIAAPAPASAPAAPIAVPEEKSPVKSILKIDTEPSVSFSDYDEVFSKSEAPELVHVPRDDDEPSDGLLQIDESSTKALGIDDVEDLEAPKPKPKPVVVPAKPIIPEVAPTPAPQKKIDDSLDSDVVVLE